MSNKKYEPTGLFSWWSWYREGLFGRCCLPWDLFDKLQSGSEYEYYRRDYPTREEALADLAQAQQTLKAQEQTVTTTTTQGEPYTWESVREGDRVRITEETVKGDLVIESVVLHVDKSDESIELATHLHNLWVFKGHNKSIELVSRPPRRVKISKDYLILHTPIGTVVVLENDDGLTITGKLWAVNRCAEGLFVYLGPDNKAVAELNLSNAKAIYTEEVQG